MSEQTFKPIKTNDVVMHEGRKHLVIAVHLDGDNIHVNLQPLDNSIKTVSLDEIQPLDSTYKSIGKNRLEINRSGRDAWDYGAKKATLKDVKTREPYTREEVISRVKTLILDEIKQSRCKKVDQKMLDNVVRRLSATQAYLVKQGYRSDTSDTSDTSAAVKSSNFIDWREIALVALKMANMYNQNII